MNGASVEDTLEVSHPDIFSGAHSMPTRSRSTAMMPMTGMHAGNRISRTGGGAEYVVSIVYNRDVYLLLIHLAVLRTSQSAQELLHLVLNSVLALPICL